ncbi:MAG TPA: type VI secretion system tube protein Hcp [Actinomycetota bacterium]|jgi:type VI secretion system secreted protein Hcp
MAFDAFLKLDGIKGESRDRQHSGEIEILSFSWGMSQTGAQGAGGGGGEGKASVHDISVTKVTDSSTPQLMKSCATGQHIATGQISVRKAGEKPVEYLKIRMTDILISSLEMGGSRSGTPSDQVTLDFKKAVFSIAPILPTGGLGTPFTVLIENAEQGEVATPPS